MYQAGLQRRLLLTAIVLWPVAVLTAYYAVHKPFTASALLQITGITLDLLLVTWINIVAWALGQWLIRKTGLQLRDRLERVALGWPLGIGTLALMSLGMGVARIWYTSAAFGLLLGLTLILRVSPRALVRAVKDLWAGTWCLGQRLAWSYILCVATLSVVSALMPPWAWDALVYHLAGPQSYIAAARFVPPESFYLALPQNGEMLYTLGMLLGSDRLPQLLHLSFAMSTGLLIYAWLRRLVSTHAAVWGLLIYAAIPEVCRLAPWAYVDMAVASFALASAYCTVQWAKDRQLLWLGLAGAYAGLGMGMKYFAVVWAGGLVVAILWMRLRTRSPISQILAPSAIFVGTSTMVLAPWLVRGMLTMGNPIYPFIFGGQSWNELRMLWLTGISRGLSSAPVSYLLLPWTATVMGVAGSTSFEADIGPVLLILAPLALLVRSKPTDVRILLWLAGCEWGAMVFCAANSTMMLQTRLFIAVLPFLVVAGVWGLEAANRWRGQRFAPDRFLRAVVVLAAVLNLLSIVSGLSVQDPIGYLVGVRDREAQLERTLGSLWQAMQAIESEVPADGRIEFLWEPRGYYCPRPCLSDATLDNLPQALNRAADAEGIAKMWRDQGITHVLLCWRGLDFIRKSDQYPLRDEDLRALEELIHSHLTSVRKMGEDYELYRLD